VIVLDDAAVRRALSPRMAVDAVRAALSAQQAGGLSAPPRVPVGLAGGDLVFTAGRLAGVGYGFRVYDTMPTSGADQLTVVFDDRTGEVLGVAGGTWLGAARTGAIGAVAVDLLADPAAATVGVVGTGTQAWSQLWALRAVRSLREARVYSRDPQRRERFAQRCRDELDLAAEPVAGAREAVADADLVVLATTSGTPVIEADWVRPDAHVTTVGPKEVGRHECPVELAARAGLLVTDSLAQLDRYAHPYFLAGTPERDRMVSLAAVQARAVTRPDATTTLFCSVGLAGTEIAVAAALFS
jgi:ornithine cyclodeaminase/alanine dehydrogenase-like protein (mu-crystallin family)